MMHVGPSGCGKTTLISIIAGILDQTEGDCVVFGHDSRRTRQNEKTCYRGECVGFVFQACNLIPTLTANLVTLYKALGGGWETTLLAQNEIHQQQAIKDH